MKRKFETCCVCGKILERHGFKVTRNFKDFYCEECSDQCLV